MLSKGNSNPEICAGNLLKTQRGEVPLDRIKGILSSSIDKPAPIAAAEIAEDTEWMLGAYEPRVKVDDVDVTQDADQVGCYVINAKVTTKEAKSS